MLMTFLFFKHFHQENTLLLNKFLCKGQCSALCRSNLLTELTPNETTKNMCESERIRHRGFCISISIFRKIVKGVQ
jgi:hypothetical protein